MSLEEEFPGPVVHEGRARRRSSTQMVAQTLARKLSQVTQTAEMPMSVLAEYRGVPAEVV